MGLLVMELPAVGARILLWLVILVLLLFSAAALQLGTLGFLALTCTWLVFIFEQVAVGTHALRRFGVR
jgi:hypothetical protein